jgi:hypothetical protein
MCDDHPLNDGHVAATSGLSRRGFLHGTAALAATAAVLRPGARVRSAQRLPRRSAARPTAADGAAAYSMAMHVHSSFSEQSASMDAQLFQAATNAVDVLWWTEHDWRMTGLGYRDTVHFTSLTSEVGGPGQGNAWQWQKAASGPLTTGSGGGIVSSPTTPNDPDPHGSLSLTAQTQTTQLAKFGYYANCQPGRWNYRDNLNGQSLSIDVLLNPGWSNGYLELLIDTSYHEASAGRPAGYYSLSYQLVPSGTAGSVAQGNEGIITIPVTAASNGQWTTVTVTPVNDIAALWPDLDYRDFALFGLTLSAASTGDLVSGYFGYLNFHRTINGGELLAQQQDMMTALAARYPSVTQQQGMEISWRLPHINWFGAGLIIPNYGDPSTERWDTKYLPETLIPQIQEAGGLVSYNHPYGTNAGPEHSQAQMDTLLSHVAVAIMPTESAPAALGADLLEVGYTLRGGTDLAHHLALWDTMSRNAAFLTGTGVNDDHYGNNWFGIRNNWTTSVWGASMAQPDLLSALTAGRTWCGSLSEFGGGTLDLLVDGSCPMGSASLSALTTRQLTVIATGIPAGGSIEVLQGTVDYAGTADPAANTQVISAYSDTDLASGQVTLPVDTSAESFVRTQVLDASGNTVAVSNPAWLLQNVPPQGIPFPRQA